MHQVCSPHFKGLISSLKAHKQPLSWTPKSPDSHHPAGEQLSPDPAGDLQGSCSWAVPLPFHQLPLFGALPSQLVDIFKHPRDRAIPSGS